MKLPKSATIMWNSKDYRRKMPRYRLAFVLLILITAGIVSIAIWNTVKLQNAIHSRTLIYVDDVSDQIADSVDLRLTEITIDLQARQRLRFADGPEPPRLSFLLSGTKAVDAGIFLPVPPPSGRDGFPTSRPGR